RAATNNTIVGRVTAGGWLGPGKSELKGDHAPPQTRVSEFSPRVDGTSSLASSGFTGRPGGSGAQGVIRAHGRCRIPFADLLRERGKSTIGPRSRARTRTRSATRARRGALAHRQATSYGEHTFGAGRRDRRSASRVLAASDSPRAESGCRNLTGPLLR